MSFREKSAWISFVLLLLLLLAFLLPTVGARLRGGELDVDSAHYFLGLIVGFALLQAVLHAIIAVRAPHEARTPKDERERLIELKAARVASMPS
jgi:uncharacterized membrane protein